MSIKINKNGKEYDLGFIPNGYPASNIKMANGDSVEDAVSELTYKSGDTVKMVSCVFPAWGGGNKRSLFFVIPLFKDFKNLTPSLTGKLHVYDSDGTTSLLTSEDVTNFNQTFSNTNGYLKVSLVKTSTFFTTAGVKYVQPQDMTLTFT